MAQVGALIWLRFRLLLTRAGAKMGGAVSQAIYFLIMMTVALGLYMNLVVLFRGLPRPAAGEVLHAALAAVWVGWVAFPLLGMSFDDSTDLSKLLLYPMTPRGMTAGVLLSDLVSSPAGFTVLLAVPVGWAHNLTDAALIIGAMAALAVHVTALVESLRILLWDLLRSRRTRDLVILLSPLLGLVIYAGYGLVLRGNVFEHWARLLSLQPSHYLRFLPSGLAASAVLAGSAGRWAIGVAYLGSLAALAAATVAVMALLVRRVQAGEAEIAAMGRAVRWGGRAGHPVVSSQARPVGRRSRLPISEAAVTVARKELVLLWRDPHLKTQLIQAVLFPAAWLIFMYFGVWSLGRAGGAALTSSTFSGVITFMLFGSFTLAANSFGADGNAIAGLFLFPAPRRALLAGKNLALWCALMIAYVPALCVLAALSRQWTAFPLAAFATGGALLPVLGVGNFLSIFSPYRLPVRRTNPLSRGSGGPGCFGLVVMTVGYVAAMALTAPFAAALFVPLHLGAPAWYWLTLPAGMGYVWWVYRILLGAAAARLVEREPEIIEAVGPAAGS